MDEYDPGGHSDTLPMPPPYLNRFSGAVGEQYLGEKGGHINTGSC